MLNFQTHVGFLHTEEVLVFQFQHVTMNLKKTAYYAIQIVKSDTQEWVQFVGKIVQMDSQILVLIV